MAAARKQQERDDRKFVARNRKARYRYRLEEVVEAGLVLLGTEVKSLRQGTASLEQAWCRIEGGEAWLVGANIPAYAAAGWTNHDPLRKRKLLLHRRQIRKIDQQLTVRGRTLVPLSLYFDASGRVKLEIALAIGKKAHDKRQAIADRDARRSVERDLRDR